MIPPVYSIEDLRYVPRHFGTVADRIWNAWWRPCNEPLSSVQAALSEVMAATEYPSFTLVAVAEKAFLGTVTVIEQDITARPELGPCIAALWVEEPARGRGVAGALVAAVCQRLATTGFQVVYLAARPHLRGYYSSRSWTLVESDVGEDALDVFARALP
jgi:predicted N-acetyltransferase YhbS